MILSLRRWTALSTAAALVLTAAAFALAQNQERTARDDGSTSPKRANPNAERAAGVIVKIEQVAKGTSLGSTNDDTATKARAHRVTHRITINTAAVWRDWARDQVTVNPKETTKAEAAEGANSVATKGEPVDKDTLIVVNIMPETEVHTRFRLLSDETSKGYKTPEEARTADRDPAADTSNPSPPERKSSQKPARPTRFQAEDLKAGLFVEVDFRHEPERDVASDVSVIRPVSKRNP